MKTNPTLTQKLLAAIAVLAALMCASQAQAQTFKLVWVTQPTTAVYGAPFNPQPVLETETTNGVFTTSGLPTHLIVTITASGGAQLMGTNTYDLGTSGSNGVVTTTGLGFLSGVGTSPTLIATVQGYGTLPVTGESIWLDASVSSSVRLNSAGYVTNWMDLSGNGHNFTTNTTGNSGNYRPAGTPTPPAYTNTVQIGRKSVSFNQIELVNSNYVNNGSTISVFIVNKKLVTGGALYPGDPYPAGGTFQRTLSTICPSCTGADGSDHDYYVAGSFELDYGANNLTPMFHRNDAPAGAAYDPSIYYHADEYISSNSLDFCFTTTSNTLAISGGSQPSAGAFSITKMAIGGGMDTAAGQQAYDGLIGDVCEVLVYNSALTSPQRTSVETYLQDKWLLGSYSNVTNLLTNTVVSTGISVSAATITITNGITVNTRLYNGTTSATLNIGTVGFTGVIPQDTGNVGLNTSAAVGTFANAGPGNNIPVTITGITLTGSAAVNYQLAPLIVPGTITNALASFSAYTITGSGTLQAGGSDPLTISAVTTNGVVNTNVDGNATVTFSGLSVAPNGTSAPTVTDDTGTPRPFGTATTLYFTNGVASLAGEAVLVAYDAQTASPHITDGTHSDAGPHGSTLSIVVSPAPNSAYRLTATGSPQVGVNYTVNLALVDQYQNLEAGFGSTKTITFTDATLPAGTDGSASTVNGAASGTAGPAISFTSGTASVTLVAHNSGAGGTLTASDGTLATSTPGGVPLAVGTILPSTTAARLSVAVNPSTPTTAGMPFTTQPKVDVCDLYLNPISASASVAASVTSVSLLGTTTVAAPAGVAAFSGLYLTNAGTYTLTFTSGSLTPAISASFVIGAGPIIGIGWVTQPGKAVVGTPFGTQPVLATVDQFGNPSTSGLYASIPVTVALTQGPGTLSGTTNYNLGSSSSNGVVSFNNLSIDAVSNDFELTATALFPTTTTPPNNSTGGMAVWLDGSDASTVIVSSNGVTQWNDKSGNHYNFGVAAGTGTIYYTNNLNGRSVVTFPNGPALLTTNNAYTFTGTSMTLFCMVRHANAPFGSFEGPFSSSSGSNDWSQVDSWSIDTDAGNPSDARFQRYAEPVSSPTTLVPGNPFIWEGGFDGSNDVEYVGYEDSSEFDLTTNYASTDPETPFNIKQLSVGARMDAIGQVSNPWNGDVAEVLLYHTNLDYTQQEAVYTYLYNKWFGSGTPFTAVTLPFTVSAPPPPGQQPVQVSLAGGAVNVTFNGAANSEYILQRSTNLTAGAGWVSISTNLSTSNTVFTVTDTFSDIGSRPETAFYRFLTP